MEYWVCKLIALENFILHLLSLTTVYVAIIYIPPAKKTIDLIGNENNSYLRLILYVILKLDHIYIFMPSLGYFH